MTKEAQLKRKAVATIRHLTTLQKLIDAVVTGKPAPKVRKRRKKSVKRKPAKKRAARWAVEPD